MESKVREWKVQFNTDPVKAFQEIIERKVKSEGKTEGPHHHQEQRKVMSYEEAKAQLERMALKKIA
jgi:hypothetical protein